MGDAAHLHHLHTFELKKIEGHQDVEAHVHAGGRYKFKVHESPEGGMNHMEHEEERGTELEE
jgi:hypothetical protein